MVIAAKGTRPEVPAPGRKNPQSSAPIDGPPEQMAERREAHMDTHKGVIDSDESDNPMLDSPRTPAIGAFTWKMMNL
ncbi:hypothetical protein VULLAG_LOCUS17481 [Vulpes lagopus]